MSPVSRRLAGAVLAGVCLAVLHAAPAGAAPAGTLDASFHSDGYSTVAVGTWAGAVADVVQPDGRIVTVGQAALGGRNVMVSTRMLPSGRLDPTYGRDGVVTVNINGGAGGYAIALQPDGRIVLAGNGRDLATYKLALAAVRLRTNGRLDSTFGAGGIATVPVGSVAVANAVAVQPDGRIVLGGTATTDHNRFALARLTADGDVDATFANRGVKTLEPTAAGWGMALQPDGKAVIAGQGVDDGRQVYMAARVGPNGSLDQSFGAGGIVAVPIGTWAMGVGVALQPDGKLVIAGDATTEGSVIATVRLNPDGSLDRTFGTNGIASFPGRVVNAFTLQPDGKIVLVGVGATAVRLNPDGSPDATFGKNSLVIAQIGTKDAANGVTVAPGGTIVLTGAATLSGRTVISVIRLFG